jgi:hypothetical protein
MILDNICKCRITKMGNVRKYTAFCGEKNEDGERKCKK